MRRDRSYVGTGRNWRRLRGRGTDLVCLAGANCLRKVGDTGVLLFPVGSKLANNPKLAGSNPAPAISRPVTRALDLPGRFAPQRDLNQHQVTAMYNGSPEPLFCLNERTGKNISNVPIPVRAPIKR